jgi:group I intron endonuclease
MAYTTTSKIPGIYKITNTVSGKCYIGSANDTTGRIANHKFKLRHNKHFNSHLQNAWNKYGEAVFTFEVILHCTAEYFPVTETFCINMHRPMVYNQRDVANTNKGKKASLETKQKMSIAQRKRTQPLEVIEKIRVGNLGKKRSAITKEKISKSKQGSSSWNKGKKLSVEHKANLSKARQLRVITQATKDKLSISGKAYWVKVKTLN